MKTAEARSAVPLHAPYLTGPRSEAKRARILEVAMRHFAERGYHAARIEDIAVELAIAKGSVFQHFGSKEGLFLAAYQKAVVSFAAYLDAPADVLAKGFFETLRYWLERTDRLVRENWVPYRIALLGNYGTDLPPAQHEINRFLRERDPYGTAAFVRMGVDRNEVRAASRRDDRVDGRVDRRRLSDALLTEARSGRSRARATAPRRPPRGSASSWSSCGRHRRASGAAPEEPEKGEVAVAPGDFTFDTALASAATIPPLVPLPLVSSASSTGSSPDLATRRPYRAGAAPGDYFTCAVAEEPPSHARDDGAIHAFSNVCRHRRARRARRGPPQVPDVRYHGWSYGLTAALATPSGRAFCARESQQSLPAVRVETWGSFSSSAWTRRRPPSRTCSARSRRDESPPVSTLRSSEDGLRSRVQLEGVRRQLPRGYHIPIVHPELFKEIDYRAYRSRPPRITPSSTRPIRSRSEGVSLPPQSAGGVLPEALYYWVFPEPPAHLYPDNLQTNIILPLGPDRTLNSLRVVRAGAQQPRSSPKSSPAPSPSATRPTGDIGSARPSRKASGPNLRHAATPSCVRTESTTSTGC